MSERALKRIPLKYILDEEAKLDDVKHMAEKEGLEKGLEQGLEQGLEKGLEQGSRKANEKTACNLLEMKMDIQAIAKVTGLSVEHVKALKEKMGFS